ncbi:MAG: hypothetical protein PHQ95_03335 [Candidatus Gracilibacteria bacterium]|nr:hypothetical protein [Candidatus Gracilibacteria bacterium]
MTVLILSIGYATIGNTWISPSTLEVGTGSGLTANTWNSLLSNFNNLDSRLLNFSFSGGNIGIGNTNPSAKLSVTGDIIGNAQVFKAYMSTNFSKAANWEKLPFDTIAYNALQGIFDTTNNRFTASRAGYYQISMAGYSATSATGTPRYGFSVLKNGIGVQISGGTYTSGDTPFAPCISIVYLNGTTDYIELYMFSAITSVLTGGDSEYGMHWYMNYLGN